MTRPSPLDWGASTPQVRGPVVCAPAADRNAIGVPAGGFAPYRALGQVTGALPEDHRPDYTGTAPAAVIGPFPQWSDPSRIVTFDPWGHRVPTDFGAPPGRDLRPTIAVTAGNLSIPEVAASLGRGELCADGRILTKCGTVAATKISIDPVWYLPGLAHRLDVAEMALRRALVDTSGGAYPELVERPDLPLFLPPIGGTSVYVFGEVARLGDPATEIACRVHDECNGSDVFGSDLCTCRPYLVEGIEAGIRTAQRGGVGIVVYTRKEGRALGEVVKYLVYNARRTDPCGDRPSAYFPHTEAVAGTADLRCQSLTMDVLHWLGVAHVTTWVSMSNLKSDALRAAGISLGDQVVLPALRMPANSTVEIRAKIASGYYPG